MIAGTGIGKESGSVLLIPQGATGMGTGKIDYYGSELARRSSYRQVPVGVSLKASFLCPPSSVAHSPRWSARVLEATFSHFFVIFRIFSHFFRTLMSASLFWSIFVDFCGFWEDFGKILGRFWEVFSRIFGISRKNCNFVKILKNLGFYSVL